jgi:hypothetical protein
MDEISKGKISILQSIQKDDECKKVRPVRICTFSCLLNFPLFRSETKDTIYLQPLGDEFDTAKDARRPDLETVKSFMASYFYPLKVEILPVWKVDRVTDSSIVFLTEPGELECQVRRSQKGNSFSVSAPDIKRKLKASKNKLNSCICIVAITLLRLHSSHGAILGEATLSSGAAIVRCFGYSTQSTEDVHKIFRVCQLIAHETSHALGAPIHYTLIALHVL